MMLQAIFLVFSAFITAILYLIPYFLPFFPPGKRAPADLAYFLREMFFFNVFGHLISGRWFCLFLQNFWPLPKSLQQLNYFQLSKHQREVCLFYS